MDEVPPYSYMAMQITPVIWDHAKRHITDEMPQGVPHHSVTKSDTRVYEAIKKIQVTTDRGLETCFVTVHDANLIEIMILTLMLGIDYQTECRTMDTPSVVLVVNHKQCKLAQILLAVLSSHASTFLMDVIFFLNLLEKQGNVQTMKAS